MTRHVDNFSEFRIKSINSAYDFEDVLCWNTLANHLYDFSSTNKPLHTLLRNTCNFPTNIKKDFAFIENALVKYFEILHVIYESGDSVRMLLRTHSTVKGAIIDICLSVSAASYLIYASTRDIAFELEDILKSLFKEFPLNHNAEETCTFKFHFRGTEGLESKSRELDAIRLASLQHNYSPQIFDAIERLLALEEPYKYGKIILHHGSPGNGKTHLIRALAFEWAKKFDITPEVIIDPEPLFENPGYLMELLATRPNFNEDPRFRFIIAEDCANLFAAGCREASGFSRLLNVVDGLLGSGQKLIFLFTANEEIHEIDPAILRPGRCLQHLHIPDWSKEDAEKWLRLNGAPEKIESLTTTTSLATLYALLKGDPIYAKPKEAFGF